MMTAEKNLGGRPPRKSITTVRMDHRVLPETKEWIAKNGKSDFLDYMYLAVKHGYLDEKILKTAIRKVKADLASTSA